MWLNIFRKLIFSPRLQRHNDRLRLVDFVHSFKFPVLCPSLNIPLLQLSL
jgi:hypothetical protein